MTEMKSVRVKVLTKNNLQILGELRMNVPLGDSYCQLSDFLNNSRSFIDLFDVAVYSEGQLLAQMPSLCINKPAIASLCEEETAQSSGSQLSSAFAY
ncbi:MAG: hypothetical protein AB1589_21800 [Cyanobacteriota bacterium]